MKNIFLFVLLLLLTSCGIIKKEYTVSIYVEDTDLFGKTVYKNETETIKAVSDSAAYEVGLRSFYAIESVKKKLASSGIKSAKTGISFTVYNSKGIDIATLMDYDAVSRMNERMKELVNSIEL